MMDAITGSITHAHELFFIRKGGNEPVALLFLIIFYL